MVRKLAPLVGLALLLPATAEAQYFGRNKVQYQHFDFKVANLELRFPLFGVLHIGSGYYGMLPLDWTIFGDAGVAWPSGLSPSLSGGDRTPVYSAGTGFRFNLFGFAVAEVNLVHPFERPGKNWLWEFNLQPGF